MKTKTSIALIAIAILSLIAIGTPNRASADSRSRQKKLDQAARHELGKDRAEFQRDRADLHNLYRSGAGRGDIYRKKAEIRDDLREIYQDRQQLSGNYGDYRRDRYDRRYDNSVWNGNRGQWNRNDNGWWNWGNSGWGSRERRDYRRD
ncbi:MAG TPA: hypothetical protein VF977_04660 [Candidatus Binatia bacterium]